MTNTIGSRIKYLRKSAGISGKSISQKLQVSAQRYSNWENKHAMPKSEELQKIVEFYDTSYDYLFGKTDRPFLSVNEAYMNELVDRKILQLFGLSPEEIMKLNAEDFERIVDYVQLIIKARQNERMTE
ncbi:helix-turn-helix domain-containing protein [Exiguobacterium artemiae]|uniref:helix-turn-helix domain-containing protein n=1 Tax=Exiguobacterium artemiae TaxID=340145 RepID=UPI003D035560